ncbi:MAG: adenylate/guanylate cyclase domain-containing protein [Alphaproteobacteria bacterium]|nr:adenylate/guanylate cyclase domain-containing protein [Alphaproteobacteria bacterium]
MAHHAPSIKMDPTSGADQQLIGSKSQYLAMSPALQQKITVIFIVTVFVTAVAMVFGAILGAPIEVTMIGGVLLGFSISAVEEFYVQGRAGAWMRRMRPILAIPIYALMLCAIFVVLQHLTYFVTGNLDALGAAQGRYHLTIPILFVTASLAILALRVVGFIGAGNLFNLLIGRYMRPIIERKVLLFLDMKDSTATVEALGAVRGKAYVGKFLFDISRPVSEHGGDIYLYTGDGLIGIWNWDTAVANGTIVAAIKAIHGAIERERAEYERDFGRVPEYRIGVHGGDVVISEQGDTKRAIGVYGDPINIAARLEQAAKEIGETCLFSVDVVDALPEGTEGFEPRGNVDVRGISEPVAICRYAWEG